MTNEQATKLPAFGAQQDLVTAIERNDYPSWRVEIQMMTDQQAQTSPQNLFDVTKIWRHKDYPLIEIGALELNRNVGNYFAEIEQACFAPSNFVSGISASPDRMLQACLMAYQDAHRYRVGTNHNEIPVNHPKCPVNHYQRDGAMAGSCPLSKNQYETPNFYPNDDRNAPNPDGAVAEPSMPALAESWIGIHDNREDDNYTQAGELYRLMSDT